MNRCQYAYTKNLKTRLQNLLDNDLNQSLNLTDTQKRKVQGDACFLLIVCSLKSEDPLVVLTHQVIKEKYWNALLNLIRVFQAPTDVRITCLIAALLLKLTRCSTSVTQLFGRWGEFVE